MTRTRRNFLLLLPIAALFLPQLGCGETKTEAPANPPPAPAQKDPGPPTAIPSKK